MNPTASYCLCFYANTPKFGEDITQFPRFTWEHVWMVRCTLCPKSPRKLTVHKIRTQLNEMKKNLFPQYWHVLFYLCQEEQLAIQTDISKPLIWWKTNLFLFFQHEKSVLASLLDREARREKILFALKKVQYWMVQELVTNSTLFCCPMICLQLLVINCTYN